MTEMCVPLPPEMHRLFQTYELLENILLHLDHISLRKARLVNALWHTIISNNPRLCTTWRQRLRIRSLRLLLLGQGDAGTRSLIEKWCYASGSARKNYDRHFKNAHVRLPETDGEVWLAHFSFLDGEGGLEALRGCSVVGSAPDAFVLVYNSKSRSSFEEVMRWWREGKLELRDGESQDHDPAPAQVSTQERGVARRRHVEQCDRPISVSCGAERNRPQHEETAKAHATVSAAVSQCRNKPVLLAIIATNCDNSSGSRRVETCKGQFLARTLDVPFYEVSTNSAESGLDAGLPLRGLWRVYKEKWKEDRAERQRRKRECVEQVEAATVGAGIEKEKESKWWQRLPWRTR